ncbi:MAG: hypothetical protein ACYC26_11885 [Phycisphaerales bacterium]
MARQITDFLINRLPCGSQLGLDFTIAGFGHETVKPAFFGPEKPFSEFLATCFKSVPFGLCRCTETALFFPKPGKHSIRPFVRQRDAIKIRGNLLGDGFLAYRWPVFVLARLNPF